jgi:hypothetical protein
MDQKKVSHWVRALRVIKRQKRSSPHRDENVSLIPEEVSRTSSMLVGMKDISQSAFMMMDVPVNSSSRWRKKGVPLAA